MAIRSQPSSHQDFFLDFTPGRANFLFLLALAVGMGLIYFLYGQPLLLTASLPTSVVAVYGGALFYSQTVHHVFLRDEIKSSPYILGFMLTLMSFFTVFTRGGEFFSGSVPSSGELESILGQIGAGIGTTVVGLIMRQVLLVNDPQGKLEDQMIQQTLDQVKTHSKTFATAQVRFVDLINEFVETREDLFNREENAFNQYVEKLERAQDKLAQIETSFPIGIQSLMEDLDTLRQHLNTNGESLGKSMSGTIGQMHKLEQGLVSLKDSVTDSTDKLAKGLEKVTQELSENMSAMYLITTLDVHESLTGSTDDLAKGLDKITQEASGRVSDTTRKMKESLENFTGCVDTVTKQLSETEGRRVEVDGQIIGSMRVLAADLIAVEAVVDEALSLIRGELGRRTEVLD